MSPIPLNFLSLSTGRDCPSCPNPYRGIVGGTDGILFSRWRRILKGKIKIEALGRRASGAFLDIHGMR